MDAQHEQIEQDLQHNQTDDNEQREGFERTPQKLDRVLIEPYLAGSLNLSAIRWWEVPELLDRALACMRYLSGRFYDRGQRGFTHLPLMLVLDLLALIELGDRAPFASEGGAHLWLPEERRLRVDYENLLLGTLLQEPSFIEARERLPTRGEVHDSAVQRLVELLLQSFGRHYPQWYMVDPAHLRDASLPPIKDLDSIAQRAHLEESLDDPGFFPEAMRQMLRGISNHVYWKELLKQEDLFELEHWALLDSEATRIGVRQISEVERRLGEFRLPRLKLRDEAMEAETDFADDTVYPTGGFSGLTTRGSFENLVRSELVYMGEGHPVSLFELRFAENELLFYMRNDGVMRRKRRFIHVILDLDTAFHYKSPGYDYPFATLTQGMIVRLTRDLLATFEEDAVTVHLHYLYRPDPKLDAESARRERARVEREVSLVGLSLSREVRQECAKIDLVDDIDLEAIQQSKGRVYAIALCFNPKSEAFWRSMFKDLEHARPPVLGITLPVAAASASDATLAEAIPLFLPMQGVSFSQVAEVKNELFARIMSGRR